MIETEILDLIPENLTVVSYESLQSRRHMPIPPNMTAVIRKPGPLSLLYDILREEYPEDHPVYLIQGNQCFEIQLAYMKGNRILMPNLDYVLVPPLPDSCAFETFQDTVAILRGPNGCPWDKKQTHQSIRNDFLQEVYELLDGLDRENQDMMLEELGDILLHIVLQTQIAIDNGEFNMGDVISHINDKIVFRHQHVFGNPEKLTADEVPARWEQIKQQERARQHKTGGLLDGISKSMPALSMAYSYQKRAAKAGFEWEDYAILWEKLAEELDEFQTAETPAEQEEELGDILFCIINIARYYNIDPETALRMTNRKFYERVHYVEMKAKEAQTDLFDIPREEKKKYWDECKAAQHAEK